MRLSSHRHQSLLVSQGTDCQNFWPTRLTQVRRAKIHRFYVYSSFRSPTQTHISDSVRRNKSSTDAIFIHRCQAAYAARRRAPTSPAADGEASEYLALELLAFEGRSTRKMVLRHYTGIIDDGDRCPTLFRFPCLHRPCRCRHRRRRRALAKLRTGLPYYSAAWCLSYPSRLSSSPCSTIGKPAASSDCPSSEAPRLTVRPRGRDLAKAPRQRAHIRLTRRRSHRRHPLATYCGLGIRTHASSGLTHWRARTHAHSLAR